MAAYEAKIGDWVIDVDTHLTEPADLWTSRLPSRYKDQAPRIVRDQESGVESWAIGESGGFLLVICVTSLCVTELDYGLINLRFLVGIGVARVT